eukprot:s2524_g5.t1
MAQGTIYRAPAGRLEEVNAQAPTNLAKAAADAGAVTFIHVSTLDVSYAGRLHRNQAPHPPEDLQLTSPIAYVRSKARGECFLADFAQGLSSMNTIVLRPGHIYAPLEGSARCAGDALAGFLRLFPPLQIGCPSVQMSMVSVETVVEAALRAAQRASQCRGRCLALKDLDANFFWFYHDCILGRHMWPLRVPGSSLKPRPSSRHPGAAWCRALRRLVLAGPLVASVAAAAIVAPNTSCSPEFLCAGHRSGACGSHDRRHGDHKLPRRLPPERWLRACARREKTPRICPSTTCMRQHGLSVMGERPTGELEARLEALAQEARILLEVAFTLADKVVVVTNAEEGWVDLSCRAWLPSLLDTVAKCEVASARSQFEPTGVTSPAGWKARAFENVIERFYQRYPNQSWKNIISIGDAPHEREALSRVVRLAPLFRGKRCRSKSIKFVLRPTIEQLCREMQMLRESLREIVLHDDDLDLHFCAETLADPLLA